ncbi:hypothetical protein Vadar_009687 [Vaccinium darrowii]|uniref:Uncharacterized protein n=1 Tax=Vaccinium darrowii TaxID=229202 RepID=A0ACB7Y660_9ERIC|nr:hypothetical protein Vadar_009687 [Vaccinium darrowii]
MTETAHSDKRNGDLNRNYIIWSATHFLGDDIRSNSTPSTNSTGNKSRSSTSSGEDIASESQKSTMGARATDSVRLMKFTKALLGPTVILDKLSELSWELRELSAANCVEASFGKLELSHTKTYCTKGQVYIQNFQFHFTLICCLWCACTTHNAKFSFIRFKRKEEATQAIDALNGILTRNFNIRVQFAKYSKSAPLRSHKNNQGGVHGGKLVSTAHRWKPVLSGVHCNQRNSYPTTYADILKGVSNGKAKLVEVKESGLDWLHMSAVGILNSYCDVNKLQDLFITNGIRDAHIRLLGGLNVLLSFDCSESLNSFLEDKDSVLPKWFSSVEAWANQSIKSSRCVWIYCFGVPLNAWCSSTFINIGKLRGDVIKLDEFTEN